MKKYKILSAIFAIIAVLLSDIMCAVVAYNYCNIKCGIEYQGFSASTNTAFLMAIPFLIGIVVSIALSWIFHKKTN